MYRVEKRFTLPIGHRLSKHKGLCSSIHGHNLIVLVGVKSKKLNENDMIIDFSDLKKIVKEILDVWDHTLLLNETDEEVETLAEKCKMRVITFNFDPTAEKLAETLFSVLSLRLSKVHIYLEYVTVYENEGSKATYIAE